MKKNLFVQQADIKQLKNIKLMSLTQRIHILQNVFPMTAIALIPVINHYHINRFHLLSQNKPIRNLKKHSTNKSTIGCSSRIGGPIYMALCHMNRAPL